MIKVVEKFPYKKCRNCDQCILRERRTAGVVVVTCKNVGKCIQEVTKRKTEQ